jgi:hypothetical protein
MGADGSSRDSVTNTTSLFLLMSQFTHSPYIIYYQLDGSLLFLTCVKVLCIEQRAQDLANIDTYREWVLLGYLVCPVELLRVRAVDIAMVILKESLLLPLFRDEVHNTILEP